MTVPVTPPSTDAFTGVHMEFSAESQGRSGVRVLRPWLKSARMVGLFYRIGMLAASRPGAVATIELFVERMSQVRSLPASVKQHDRAAS